MDKNDTSVKDLLTAMDGELTLLKEKHPEKYIELLKEINSSIQKIKEEAIDK